MGLSLPGKAGHQALGSIFQFALVLGVALIRSKTGRVHAQKKSGGEFSDTDEVARD
jgi:hypothetical protein